MTSLFSRSNATLACLVAVAFIFFSTSLPAQMRKVYLDADEDNEVYGASFYTASEGYVGFRASVGYTADSGKTFVKKFITNSNVDFNGYGANLTFGFGVYGVKAFDQNKLIVYGDYGMVPAILYSSNGGSSFKLVFHSQFNGMQLLSGVTDMVFPQNGNTGYAVDADRILKTTDKGLTWSVAFTAAGSFFTDVEAIDAENIIAISNDYRGYRIYKSSLNGTQWNRLTLPSLQEAKLESATFLTTTTGWISMVGNGGKSYVYKTTNGGSSWIQVNNTDVTPFSGYKMKFTNANTGYALSGQNTVWKTLNGGAIWERLPRDNNFSYLGYTHNDLEFFSDTQFWTGGRHGFLEMTNNGGGTPLPRALAKVDTFGLGATGLVSLINFSRTDYTHQWLLNGNLISTNYSTTYTRDLAREKDTIKLVVFNGVTRDTATFYQQFHPPVIITSFTPDIAGKGTVVTITGANLNNAYSVLFGGVRATDVNVISPTQITAKVGDGATGDVAVVTSTGYGKRPGFTFIPPPVITAFTPQAAAAGVTVTITGSEFNYVRGVSFAGPQSAGYKQVSVLANNRTAWSNQRFNLTFPGAVDTFSVANFSLPVKKDIVGGIGFDMDGDGKLDLMTGNTVARNTSNPGNISFAAPDSIIRGVRISSSYLADMDGDGKQDMVITNYASPTLSIMRNTSTPGTYSFVKEGNYPTGYYAQGSIVTISDVDGDGRPDVITRNSNSQYIFSVLKNSSTPGATSLEPRIEYELGIVYSFEMADIDNDDKPDMLLLYREGYFNKVGVRRNISVPGRIAFDNLQVLASTDESWGMRVFDMDSDGKLDIYLSGDRKSLTLLANQSTPGNFSFNTKQTTSPVEFGAQTVSDLDGDGKPDIISVNVPSFGDRTLDLFKNNSTSGNLSVKAPLTFIPIKDMWLNDAADVDGDGMPDIILPGGGYTVFLRNMTGIGVAKKVCANASLTLNATITGTTYQWQMHSGDGFVNLTENQNCQGVSSPNLQLVNIPATWNYYEFRCVVNGSQYSPVYKLDIPPTLVPSVFLSASNTDICEGAPVIFNAIPQNGGDAPSYQWKKNDANVGTNSKTYTASDLKNNDVIGVVMSSSVACPSVPSIASTSTIKMKVGTKTASVTISANNTIVKLGETVAVMVVPVNGGTSPLYYWQDSTDNRGWINLNTAWTSGINYKPTVDGAKLRCMLLTSEKCVPAPATFYSNVLTFKVNTVTAIDPEPAASFGIRYFPNPVSTTLSIGPLNLADKWESISISGIDGKQKTFVRNIAGQSSLTIDVSTLPAGYYVLTINRKQGGAAYLKFMKL